MIHDRFLQNKKETFAWSSESLIFLHFEILISVWQVLYWPPKICNKIYGTRLNLDKFAKEQMHQLGKIDPINVNKFGKFGCTISLRVKFTSFCSNIDSKSSNNTYLNINKILFSILFFISCINNIECKIW